MKKDKSATAMPDEIYDDLTIIDGLGEGSAKILNKINIRRVADLAKYNGPGELHQALLEADIRSIPLSRIENKNSPKQMGDWLQQARELVEGTDDEASLLDVKTAVPNSPGEEWQEHAHFDLIFESKLGKDGLKVWRTYVIHEQGYNDDPLDYPGIEDTSIWVNWILERANLPAVAKRLPTSAEVDQAAKKEAAPQKASGKVEVKILDVDINLYKPMSEQLEKQLEAQIRFQLTGAGAESLAADGYPLEVQVYTVDLDSQDTQQIVSDEAQIQPLSHACTHPFPMPEVGHYQLQGQIALSLADKKVTTDFVGPKFRVNP